MKYLFILYDFVFIQLLNYSLSKRLVLYTSLMYLSNQLVLSMVCRQIFGVGSEGTQVDKINLS
jgi:hypothetical protein